MRRGRNNGSARPRPPARGGEGSRRRRRRLTHKRWMSKVAASGASREKLSCVDHELAPAGEAGGLHAKRGSTSAQCAQSACSTSQAAATDQACEQLEKHARLAFGALSSSLTVRPTNEDSERNQQAKPPIEAAHRASSLGAPLSGAVALARAFPLHVAPGLRQSAANVFLVG